MWKADRLRAIARYERGELDDSQIKRVLDFSAQCGDFDILARALKAKIARERATTKDN